MNDDLDALIAEAEASEMAAREELLAAGEDPAVLDKIAAKFSNMGELTAAEREEYGKIYGLARAKTNAMPDFSHMEGQVPPHAARLPGEVALNHRWLVVGADPEGEPPKWGNALTHYCSAANLFDPRRVLEASEFDEWTYDFYRNSVRFMVLKVADLSRATQMEKSTTILRMHWVEPAATVGEHFICRLDAELKRAREELLEKVREEDDVTYWIDNLRIAARYAAMYGRCSGVAVSAGSRSRLDRVCLSLWAGADPFGQIDPERVRRAIADAVCGPLNVEPHELASATSQTAETRRIPRKLASDC